MTRHDSLMRSGTVLFLMTAILTLFAFECPADYYRPGAAVSIVSEYTAMNDSAPPFTQAWKVVPETGPDGSFTLGFFLETANGTDAVCELAMPPSGADGLIRWQGTGKNVGKTSDNGLLLAAGFPAPCDILPVAARAEDRLYQETSRAGGSVFTRTYRISSEAFSIDDARARGWIRAVLPDTAGELIMVTVTDDRGRLTVRQLWPVNGSWWIFEETPQRRSWLLN